MSIGLPGSVDAIEVQLHAVPDAIVTLTGLLGGVEVSTDSAFAGASEQLVLRLEGETVDQIIIRCKGRSVLERVCLMNDVRGCAYIGTIRLDTAEELGTWSTYLFAQTRNDVPRDTDPLVAARTIGGLPVTHNFVFAGDSESIGSGHLCNIDLVQDGTFDVVLRTVG